MVYSALTQYRYGYVEIFRRDCFYRALDVKDAGTVPHHGHCSTGSALHRYVQEVEAHNWRCSDADPIGGQKELEAVKCVTRSNVLPAVHHSGSCLTPFSAILLLNLPGSSRRYIPPLS